MADITGMLQAAAGNVGGAEETDPNFNQTVLLLHGDGTNGAQNNTFLDSSTNNFTITRNGNVTQGSFSPFGRTSGNLDDVYNPAVNGGSGYFDGTGDYLLLPSNAAFAFGTGAYTIEAWVYLPAYAATQGSIFDSGNATGALDIGITSTGAVILSEYNVGNILTSTAGDVPLNAWTHVALVRESTASNDTFIYVNGVLVATGTNSKNWTVTTNPTVGGITIAGYLTIGYLSSVRVVKGTAVYTAAFTPPTAPLTAISGTSLLCNFTNAGIFDNTGKNNLETVGNAQIDTTTKKYGTGSMEFDGTGDYLLLTGSQDLALGTGDFTIEFWFNVDSTASTPILMDFRPVSTNGVYPMIYINSGGTAVIYEVSSAARITGTTTISTGTWYFFSLSRSGTSTKMFIDGTQVGSTYTDSNNYLVGASRPVIGGSGFNTGNNQLDGYIDDLRITKGVARYTTTFTPPTKAFPDL